MAEDPVNQLAAEEDLKKDLSIPSRDVHIGQMLEVESTPELERRVLWKLDLLLIPLMGFGYFLQFLDKLAISQATMFGFRQDLKLQGSQYSWASSIFYFGYLFWSWPSSYVIVRLPIGKYLAVTVFFWGGILMCHAACTNFAGLMTVRFFLGVGEAAIAPGFALITGMFYKREEQPLRQSAWFLGNCVATLLGGLIAWGIGNIKGSGIASWQLLFLILGAVTSAYGFVLFFFLPESPAKVVFLTSEERAIALQRTLKNKTGVMDNGSFKWGQVLQAAMDPQAWFVALYTFCVSLCNGGITSFSSILIAGFGWSNLKALIMQMPQGAAQIVFLLITSTIATHVRSSRLLVMILNTLTSMIGMILIWKLGEEERVGRLTGLCLGAVFAINIPLLLSIVSSNVAGFTKRSVVNTAVFIAYCVGNIAGPQFFIRTEEPQYPTGIKASMSGLILGIFFLVCLYTYYTWENHRRDAKYGPPIAMSESEELRDELSSKTDQEIESFHYLLHFEKSLPQGYCK